jgi:biotin carboxylase
VLFPLVRARSPQSAPVLDRLEAEHQRGEAAVRFMRAARSWSRERGIPLSVVALYTDADADAPFVRMATSSVCLGAPMVAGEDGKQRQAQGEFCTQRNWCHE